MLPIIIFSIEEDFDREFMTGLYYKYRDLMFGKAKSIVKSADDAEDVVQNAVIKLIDKVELLEVIDRDKLPAYVLAVTKNCAIDFYRRQKHLREKVSAFDDEPEGEPSSEKDLTEELAISAETVQELMEAIEKLTESERDLLVNKYLLGYDNAEIAKIAGIPQKNVSLYLWRAKKKALSCIRMEDYI